MKNNYHHSNDHHSRRYHYQQRQQQYIPKIQICSLVLITLYAVVALEFFMQLKEESSSLSLQNFPTKKKIESRISSSSSNKSLPFSLSSLSSSSSSSSLRPQRNIVRLPRQVKQLQKNQKQKTRNENQNRNKGKNRFPLHVSKNDFEMIQHPGILFLPPRVVEDKNSTLNELLKKKVSVPRFWSPSPLTNAITDGTSGKFTFIGNNNNDTNILPLLNISGTITVKDNKNNSKKTLYDNHGSFNRSFTQQDALSIGSFYNGMETIFISLASYRDPDCINTLESIYLRAKYPERIRVAIIDQRMLDDGVDDPKCIPTYCQQDTMKQHPQNNKNMNTKNQSTTICNYIHLVDRYEMDARIATGPIFARHIASRYYRGEYFIMQIDAHVRFIQDWDASIIQQWKETKNEMAVLTVYMSDLNGSIDPVTHQSRLTGARPIMCDVFYEQGGGGGKKKNKKQKIYMNKEKDLNNNDKEEDYTIYKYIRYGQQPIRPVPSSLKAPTLHPFWAAGFSFARGHFAYQVPYDPYLPLVFQGEEISMTVRGFTFGYDYYGPIQQVCFHMYALYKNLEERMKVPKFWEHTDSLFGGYSQYVTSQAMKRMISRIGMVGGLPFPSPSEVPPLMLAVTSNNRSSATSKTADFYDKNRYGLGTIRKKEIFYETFGIHTDTQTIEENLCSFAGEYMNRIFLPALSKDGMGINYDKLNYKFVDPLKKNM